MPGDTGFSVFEHRGAAIGMMICFDWYFPESARTLALRGAQIIAHPSNLVLPHCQTAMVTRCLENRVFAITTNRYGTETLGEKRLTFTGASQLVNPKGERLLKAPVAGDRVLFAEIDPSLADDKRPTSRNHLLNDRRPAFALYLTRRGISARSFVAARRATIDPRYNAPHYGGACPPRSVFLFFAWRPYRDPPDPRVYRLAPRDAANRATI